MINFLLDLISNLIILAVLLTACCVINWMRPDAKADGYLVFVVFVAIALLFDAALTRGAASLVLPGRGRMARTPKASIAAVSVAPAVVQCTDG
ncbi:hypothetical protein [Paraburkholderia terrae]